MAMLSLSSLPPDVLVMISDRVARACERHVEPALLGLDNDSVSVSSMSSSSCSSNPSSDRASPFPFDRLQGHARRGSASSFDAGASATRGIVRNHSLDDLHPTSSEGSGRSPYGDTPASDSDCPVSRSHRCHVPGTCLAGLLGASRGLRAAAQLACRETRRWFHLARLVTGTDPNRPVDEGVVVGYLQEYCHVFGPMRCLDLTCSPRLSSEGLAAVVSLIGPSLTRLRIWQDPHQPAGHTTSSTDPIVPVETECLVHCPHLNELDVWSSAFQLPSSLPPALRILKWRGADPPPAQQEEGGQLVVDFKFLNELDISVAGSVRSTSNQAWAALLRAASCDGPLALEHVTISGRDEPQLFAAVAESCPGISTVRAQRFTVDRAELMELVKSRPTVELFLDRKRKTLGLGEPEFLWGEAQRPTLAKTLKLWIEHHSRRPDVRVLFKRYGAAQISSSTEHLPADVQDFFTEMSSVRFAWAWEGSLSSEPVGEISLRTPRFAEFHHQRDETMYYFSWPSTLTSETNAQPHLVCTEATDSWHVCRTATTSHERWLSFSEFLAQGCRLAWKVNWTLASPVEGAFDKVVGRSLALHRTGGTVDDDV
jgi:hypothetical protein